MEEKISREVKNKFVHGDDKKKDMDLRLKSWNRRFGIHIRH